MKSVCYFCDRETPERRHPGCHAECKEFKEWKSGENEKLNKRIDIEKEESTYISYLRNSREKMMRRTRKK